MFRSISAGLAREMPALAKRVLSVAMAGLVAVAGLALCWSPGFSLLGQDRLPGAKPSARQDGKGDTGLGEEAILRALEERTDVSFTETPLSEVAA